VITWTQWWWRLSRYVY